MTRLGAKIVAIETHVPERVVTNAELDARHPAWKVAEVARRTGIESRRWAAPGETALDLAEKACERLLERTGTPPEAIDALLFCTQTPDHAIPANSCLLQARLKLPRHVAALDFPHACSGYLYGLYLAKALVESGAAKTVLLVTAETYSKLISAEDRGTATLFGDGAAATLITAGEASIGRVFVGTDGSAPEVFSVPAGGARTPRSARTSVLETDESGNLRSAEHICMDGGGILAFVQRDITMFIREKLDELGLTIDDLDLVVFHQASKTVLDFLKARLAVPAEKLVVNLAELGNTVSASIPMALRAAELDGRLRPGMEVLIAGFGAGLSWGACVITWQGQ
jgi:3-oxoacyl-[acyl-carrier-protein] synthase-3